MTADDRDDVDSPDPELQGAGDESAGSGEQCWNCGAALPEGAMFCGECGSAAGARASQPVEEADGAEAAAADLELPVEDPGETGLPPHGDALLENPVADAEPPARVPDRDAPEHAADEERSGLPPHGDALLDPDAASAWPLEGPGEELAAGSAPEAPEPSGEDDGADPLAPLTPEERFAAERLLDPESEADRFVLQFSTGESATVYGSGLLGRNPVAEPGEYVDHLVVIRDPGRSVSKTHLEFGQDGGLFWVLDRYSGNGSVLREPGGTPKRCEPGRRYVVARGTRIEIGDQFFVVS